MIGVQAIAEAAVLRACLPSQLFVIGLGTHDARGHHCRHQALHLHRRVHDICVLQCRWHDMLEQPKSLPSIHDVCSTALEVVLHLGNWTMI